MEINIASEAELAKTSVLNSPLDKETKRHLIALITKSALATNGITPEQKIQYLTECMATLATALATYMTASDKHIESIEQMYKQDHPEDRLERIQKFESYLTDAERYRDIHGIKQAGKDGIADKIFGILAKPYAWIFGCVAVCSPYALDLFNAIIAHFDK